MHLGGPEHAQARERRANLAQALEGCLKELRQDSGVLGSAEVPGWATMWYYELRQSIRRAAGQHTRPRPVERAFWHLVVRRERRAEEVVSTSSALDTMPNAMIVSARAQEPLLNA